jgi:acetyl-CoA carboxylase carboxyl transferase subunit alpha
MTALTHPLDFERPLVELELQLERLKDEIAGGDLSRRDEYAKLESKVARVREDVYGKLSAYQRVQLSRHFDRPFTLDYIKYIFTDFIEFHGDRCFGDDRAIVGGTARLGSQPVMIVGHQRGRTTTERLERNFGMANPEGYRKALRLFRMAEKFGLPLFTFIDTQGAFPGLEAEERGQAEAIATNLLELSELTVPILSTVIGEGGSGGALALGVADRILMLENACYSVITPEGCASILYRTKDGESSSDQAASVAEMLQLTAPALEKLGVIDGVVPEPVGGAHRSHKEAAENLRAVLVRELEALSKLTVEELLEQRYQKFRAIGRFSSE